MRRTIKITFTPSNMQPDQPSSGPRWTRFVHDNAIADGEQAHLRKRGLAAKIERGESGAERDALAVVVSMRTPRRETPAVERGRGERIQAGSPAEREHARAIADRIAIVANNDPEVLAIRESLGIPRKGLSAARARALLASPLLARVMTNDLERWHVPVSDHEATVVRRERRGGREVVQIRVRWAGGARVVKLGGPIPAEPEFIEFPNEKGRRRVAVEIESLSILGEVKRLAERLAAIAPFNAFEQSAVGAIPALVWLILTGVAVPLVPITVGREIPGSVDTVTVCALVRVVSPESMIAALAKVRKSVFGEKRKGRAFAPRNLAVVVFVEKRTGGPVPKFPPELRRMLWKEWNAAHPKEKFGEVQEMERAYLRTKPAFFPDDAELWDLNVLAAIEAEITARERRGRRAR